MYKNVLKHYKPFAIIVLFACCSSLKSQAQITLTGQLRDRAEDRNGYGNMVLQDSKNSGFVSQRTRLNFGYKWDELNFALSLQGVGVRGSGLGFRV